MCFQNKIWTSIQVFSWLSLLWTTAPCKIKSFDTTDWLKKDSTLFNCGCESSRKCNLQFFFYKIKKRKSGAECISLKNKEPASVFFSICRSKPALIWWERQTADLISLAGGPPLAFIQLKHYIGLSQSVFNLVNKSCFGSLLFQYCYTKKWL